MCVDIDRCDWPQISFKLIGIKTVGKGFKLLKLLDSSYSGKSYFMFRNARFQKNSFVIF